MKVRLQYCAAWNYEPKAVSLATKILMQYKQQLDGFELVPSSGGCFELKVGDELIYSKLKTGQFPDETAMVAEVGKRL